MRPRAHRFPRHALAVTALVLLSGCGGRGDGADPGAASAASGPAATTAPALADEGAQAGVGAGFDLSGLPLSEVALGEFPYFEPPEGFEEAWPRDRHDRTRYDFARFPFQAGAGIEHWVEGRFHQAGIGASGGRAGPPAVLRRHVEAEVARAGGRLLFEGRIPSNRLDAHGAEVAQGFIEGRGDVWNHPVAVFAIRRPDTEIWIHLVAHDFGASWIIGEQRPLPPGPEWRDGFPWLALPDGYEVPRRAAVEQADARFPFLTADGLHWVQGRVHGARIAPADGRAFSMHELRAQLDRLVGEAGGRLVHVGMMPRALREELGREFGQALAYGLGDIWNEPVHTWRVEHAGRELWVHLVMNTLGGEWVVVEAAGTGAGTDAAQ